MNTRSSLSVALVLAAVGLANCTFSASPPVPPPNPPELPAPAANPLDTKHAVDASNCFGLDLFRSIAKDAPNQNLFLSPFSISIALTMAAEGARGETAHEMNSALRIPEANAGRGIDSVHAGYAELARHFAAASGNTDPATRTKIESLRKQLDEANAKTKYHERGEDWKAARESHTQAENAADELNALLTTVDRFDLRVANSLWIEQTFPLLPEYSATIDKWYGTGGVTPVDFLHQPDKSRLRINAWVEDHTENRIKDLLPAGSITPDTRLVIANAVYFKGQWSRPFEQASTHEEDFHVSSDKTIKSQLMQDHYRAATRYAAFDADGTFFDTPKQVPRDEAARPPCYPADDGFSIIELPYKGGDLAMTLILPRSPTGLAPLESHLSASALDGWLTRLDSRVVDAAMPRFKMEFERELSAPLKSLGMKHAFVSPNQANGADFGGMSASTDPAQQLYIGLVQHKAWVEVTETGTEAAAATALAMYAAAMARPIEMVPFNPVFRADHPFLFLIRDTKSGVILFMGCMLNPAAN